MDALERQTTEVIVVDDRSSDGTSDIARSHGAEVVEVQQRSAARARNVGASRSKGEIIAFTDSDCIPAPDWIETISSEFEDAPDANIIGGSISMREDTHFRRSYATMYRMTDAKHLVDGSIMLPAMNLSIRRQVFNQLMFDENLPGALCDDVDFLHRASSLGMRILYRPRVKVTHLNPSGLRNFVRQELRHGMGDSIFRRRYPEYGGGQRRTFTGWVTGCICDMPGHVKAVKRETGSLALSAGVLNYIRHVVGGYGHLRAQRLNAK